MTDRVYEQTGLQENEAAQEGLNSGGYFFTDAFLQSLLLLEPSAATLQNNKLVKIIFSKRGLLSNSRARNAFKQEFEEKAWEVDPGINACWHKPGINNCPVLESRLMELAT